MTYDIPDEILASTIEAMRNLKERYASEAYALARLDSLEAKDLALERIEDFAVASGLHNFYIGLEMDKSVP